MKVIELCLSPDKGGLELYVSRVASHLARSGVGCLAVLAPDSKIASLCEAQGVACRRLRATALLFPVLAARRLAAWIDAEAVDVIHVHWAKDLNLAVLARRFAKRPVRLVYSRQMAITRSKHDWYHRLLYRHVDLVIVITRRLQEEARRFLPLPPERVQLLYYGVAPPPQMEPPNCAEVRESLGIPPAAFAVALFGRIEPAKGQQVLVDAMALLAERGCDAYAVLFGHPMQARHLEELQARISRLRLDARIRFGGFHPRPQEIMRCFDCVTLTTYNETFGLVLAEAMRAGVAVIGTDAGGVPEIVEDGKTGLLVAPGDSVALANAIERLVRDPVLRSRLAAAGRTSADARFDEGQHFEHLDKWLRGIAKP